MNAADYPGARGELEQVFAEELRQIEKRRARYGIDSPASCNDFVGLALSGGGIRSATFALGVMQALAKQGLMKHVDYLSTVSGGGYIGSSLTWFVNKHEEFDLSAEKFPFQTEYGLGKQQVGVDHPSADRHAAVLRWIRQRGNYLVPGDGLNLASFAAVILRSVGLSLAVYFPLIVLGLYVLWAAGFYRDYALPIPFAGASLAPLPGLICLGIVALALLALGAIAYSLFSFSSRYEKTDVEQVRKLIENWYYMARRNSEIWSGRLLVLAVVFLLLGSVKPVSAWLDGLSTESTASPYSRLVRTDQTTMQGTKPPQAGAGAIAGFLSALAGLLTAIGVIRKSARGAGSQVVLSLVASIAAALMLYGIVLVAYGLLGSWLDWPSASPWQAVLLAILVFGVGFFTNLNYVSIHRYYRDRLMEAFMPDYAVPGDLASRADRSWISEFAGDRGPYHLVNTNVLLSESRTPKYRGRGGDSFILSPDHCGSEATGWRRTKDYMDDLMTLSTAMAISGAAANPHTGIGGSGVTRNPFVALLMGLLNVRLGYWVPNPARNPVARDTAPDSRRLAGDGQLGGGWSFLQSVFCNISPNFFYPGIYELANLKKLNEKSRFLELTDGGHFENLGLYELLRRGCGLIICCDGSADPGFGFNNLSNAMEKARTDFGIVIDLSSDELSPLIPKLLEEDSWQENPVALSDRAFVVGTINYPPAFELPHGKLIYIKTTLTKDMPAELYGYKRSAPRFPDESTGDQFFHERQFEAYRQLGFQIAHMMWSDGTQKESLRDDLGDIGKLWDRAQRESVKKKKKKKRGPASGSAKSTIR